MGVLSSSPMALTFLCIVLLTLNRGWEWFVIFFHSQPRPSERGLLPHLQLQEPSTSQEHSIPAFQAEEGAALARILPLPQTESSSYIKFINSWQERNPPIGRNRCSTSNFCHHDSVPNIIVLKCGGMLIFF